MHKSAAPKPRAAQLREAHAKVGDSPWSGQREHSERARRAKRESVILAAAKAFAVHGVDGTSMDDIAAALSVTKPTIYRAVGDKAALVQACERRMNDRFLEALKAAEAIGGTGLSKALYYQRLSLQLIDRDDFGRLVLALSGNRDPMSTRSPFTRELREKVQSRVRAWLETDRRAGLIRAEIDPRMATLALFAVFNFIPRWYRREGPASLDEIFEHHQRMFVWALTEHPDAHALKG